MKNADILLLLGRKPFLWVLSGEEALVLGNTSLEQNLHFTDLGVGERGSDLGSNTS